VQGLRPAQWAKRVVTLYHERKASRVVAEVNQGGAMVEQVLREVDRNLSFRAVHASVGKSARAEAIMPLSRGADGKLGVRGGGGVNVTVNISTPDIQSFNQSQGQIAALMAQAIMRGQRNL
jgi:hypothetical protein